MQIILGKIKQTFSRYKKDNVINLCKQKREDKRRKSLTKRKNKSKTNV